MTPKFKIGDWVKTRKNKVRQIVDFQKNKIVYGNESYFVYKLSGELYNYYEFWLTLFTDEEKLELL